MLSIAARLFLDCFLGLFLELFLDCCSVVARLFARLLLGCCPSPGACGFGIYTALASGLKGD